MPTRLQQVRRSGETLSIVYDGQVLSALSGETVAAALTAHGVMQYRHSRRGERRGIRAMRALAALGIVALAALWIGTHGEPAPDASQPWSNEAQGYEQIPVEQLAPDLRAVVVQCLDKCHPRTAAIGVSTVPPTCRCLEGKD